jgi:hypothetical protein
MKDPEVVAGRSRKIQRPSRRGVPQAPCSILLPGHEPPPGSRAHSGATPADACRRHPSIRRRARGGRVIVLRDILRSGSPARRQPRAFQPVLGRSETVSRRARPRVGGNPRVKDENGN